MTHPSPLSATIPIPSRSSNSGGLMEPGATQSDRSYNEIKMKYFQSLRLSARSTPIEISKPNRESVMIAASAPIPIPHFMTALHDPIDDDDDNPNESDEEEFIPPHLLVQRGDSFSVPRRRRNFDI
eukprot:TRINITY_DN3267_c0_g1_i1.p1 TRINITY_DN3267_c0_g1~~TRINITY_DN3267_c0_g1_i1.p1  ORF type:complete len:126 (-),score=15.85 TRINITY_DN3267_c0_g1_i1:289-666(-)